jgi:hypothetical protein
MKPSGTPFHANGALSLHREAAWGAISREGRPFMAS